MTGAQRFGASGGLAVEKSELQTGVAGGLGWASGDFGMGGDDASAKRRRLNFWSEESLWMDGGQRRRLQKAKGKDGGKEEEDGTDEQDVETNSTIPSPPPPPDRQRDELKTLRSKLTTFYIVVGLIGGGVLFGTLYYKYRANRRYYKELGLLEFQRRALYKHTKKKKGKDGVYRQDIPKAATFRSMPGSLVFPGLLCLGINFFLNGLIEPCITLVSFPADLDTCGSECMVPAVTVLTLLALYLLTTFAMLLHFHRSGYREETWEDAEEPEDPNDVEDPLYRFISKVRVRFCVPERKFNIMDRPRGEFVRPEDDEVEPARTERLLRYPLSLFRSRPADALDALKLAWFQRANGSGFVGVSYDLIAVLAGLAVAGLNGAGKNIEPGSQYANAQVLAVFSVQMGTSLYVSVVKPSADRIDNWLTCAQFFVEGSQTGVLLLGAFLAADGDLEGSTTCQTAGFWFGLFALFIPILEKVYDAVINQISACCRGEFDPVGFFYAFVALLLAIPGTVMAMLGMAGSDELDTLIGSVDEGLGVLETAMEDGILDNAADVASDLFWMRSSQRHNKAANTLQATWRGVQGRKMLEVTKGAQCQQVLQRSREELVRRRQARSQVRAAVMVQRTCRASKARAKLENSGGPEYAAFVKQQRAKLLERRAMVAIDREKRSKQRESVLAEKSARAHDLTLREASTMRPGFDWLETLIDEDEEAEEAEDEKERVKRLEADEKQQEEERKAKEAVPPGVVRARLARTLSIPRARLSRTFSMGRRIRVATQALPEGLPEAPPSELPELPSPRRWPAPPPSGLPDFASQLANPGLQFGSLDRLPPITPLINAPLGQPSGTASPLYRDRLTRARQQSLESARAAPNHGRKQEKPWRNYNLST